MIVIIFGFLLFIPGVLSIFPPISYLVSHYEYVLRLPAHGFPLLYRGAFLFIDSLYYAPVVLKLAVLFAGLFLILYGFIHYKR